MRILGPVVQPLVRAVLDVRHDLTLGGRVGAELVGDHPTGGQPCLRKSRFNKRLAALVLRRVWITSSST